jgi:predicted DNA binding CopG/RHH family protein
MYEYRGKQIMNTIPAAEMIQDTEDAWLSGALGEDEKYAQIAPDNLEAMLNESLDLQPISIRLEKSLIDAFKIIASIHGVGYQPLMRQTLKRFAECELKDIARGMAVDMAAKREAEELKHEVQEKKAA